MNLNTWNSINNSRRIFSNRLSRAIAKTRSSESRSGTSRKMTLWQASKLLRREFTKGRMRATKSQKITSNTSMKSKNLKNRSKMKESFFSSREELSRTSSWKSKTTLKSTRTMQFNLTIKKPKTSPSVSAPNPKTTKTT